ncbi:MAG: hypothetical protein ACXVII_45470 [Solirubrobacteraceae bacterium]
MIVAAEQAVAPTERAGALATILGPVINSQGRAAGGHHSYFTFLDVFNRAYAEVEALEGLDREAKEEATGRSSDSPGGGGDLRRNPDRRGWGDRGGRDRSAVSTRWRVRAA